MTTCILPSMIHRRKRRELRDRSFLRVLCGFTRSQAPAWEPDRVFSLCSPWLSGFFAACGHFACLAVAFESAKIWGYLAAGGESPQLCDLPTIPTEY